MKETLWTLRRRNHIICLDHHQSCKPAIVHWVTQTIYMCKSIGALSDDTIHLSQWINGAYNNLSRGDYGCGDAYRVLAEHTNRWLEPHIPYRRFGLGKWFFTILLPVNKSEGMWAKKVWPGRFSWCWWLLWPFIVNTWLILKTYK